MDAKTANAMRVLDNRFYGTFGRSFSKTRNNSWPGWNRLLEHMEVFPGFDPLHGADALRDGGVLCAAETHQDAELLRDADALRDGGVLHGAEARQDTGALQDPGAPQSVTALQEAGGGGNGNARATLSVFDLACGNMRFERYLLQKISATRFAFYMVDSDQRLASDNLLAEFLERHPEPGHFPAGVSDSFSESGSRVTGPSGNTSGRDNLLVGLSDERMSLHFTCFDALVEDEEVLADIPACDLAVCFGFMHHVPTHAQRLATLRLLASKTAHDGTVCASFWCFMDDPAFAKRAVRDSATACSELGLGTLGEGDYLVGWQNSQGAWRYCHHYTPEEIDQLVAECADLLEPVLRYRADGATGRMNEYVVWRRI